MTDPLDAFLPEFTFRERHQVRVDRPPEAVWAALQSTTAADLPLVRLLMRARTRSPLGERSMLETMASRGWFELDTEPGRHAVNGSIGQFWRRDSTKWRRYCAPEEFRTREEPGFAKSAAAFQVVPDGDGTLLSTETRVHVGDTGYRMALYWMLIRPFSGLIRRAMLRAVSARAT
ncbi:hypothetical protein [Spirillospora sp. CA-294931]|uniref:hypothetical protein n=1 Tax=Spirillospora sp. CA-294931 TaxID=3240042 RepID=UPI003D8BAFA7